MAKEDNLTGNCKSRMPRVQSSRRNIWLYMKRQARPGICCNCNAYGPASVAVIFTNGRAPRRSHVFCMDCDGVDCNGQVDEIKYTPIIPYDSDFEYRDSHHMDV